MPDFVISGPRNSFTTQLPGGSADAQAARIAAALSAAQVALATIQANIALAAAANTTASAAGAALSAATLTALNAITMDPMTGSAPAEGRQGVVYGTGSDAGIYRRLSGAWVLESRTVPQIDASSRLGEAAGAIATAYLDDDPSGIQPLLMDTAGNFVSWVAPDGTISTPESRRLDTGDRQGAVPQPLLSDSFGAVLSTSEDGAVLLGRRVDGAMQLGPAPGIDYVLDVRGSVGSRQVWLAGHGVPAFQLSTPIHTGDNFGARFEGDGSVRWLNAPAAGSPAIIRRSLLGDSSILASGVTDLWVVGWLGQSTACGISAVTAVSTTTPAPGRVLMFDNGGPRILRHGHDPSRPLDVLPDYHLAALVNAVENVHGTAGETQATQAGFEFQKRMGAAHAVIVATAAIGSQPYSAVKQGTPPGSNFLAVVREAWLIAKLRGLNFRAALCIPQFEAEQANTQAQYLAKMVEAQAQFSAAIADITNGVAAMPLVVSGFANATAYAVATSQQPYGALQWALDNPTVGVYAAPGYLFPTVGDLVHRTAAGNALEGAYAGRALARLMRAENALPLYTSSTAINTGLSRITGTVQLPLGAVGLTSTSAIVTNPGNLGFTLRRQDNDASVPVASANVASSTTYQVFATTPPTGVPLWLEIGARGTSGVGAGPTTGMRTPLNDGNTDTSAFSVVMANHHAIQRLSVTF